MKKLILFCVLLMGSLLLSAQQPVDSADPFIGTGKAGNCYPGAQAPFGMISWSPNTTFDDYQSEQSRPGYKYNRTEINGFSLTHLSGVGCHAAQDLPIMPVSGKLPRSPVRHPNGYKSAFSHQQESAKPGFYQVFLSDYDINVELSVTERSGIARFTFPEKTERHILFRPTEGANGISGGFIKIDKQKRKISGWVRSGGFCSRNPKDTDYTLFFAAEFDQSIRESGFWKGESQLNADTCSGEDFGAYVSFSASTGKNVFMKIGLSYVSIENADLNLQKEIPSWNSDSVKVATRKSWNDLLRKVTLDASEKEKRIFYSALYHNFLQPSIFEDVNGDYIGFDNQIHQMPAGHHKYVNFSNWDTYRTSAQLQGLLVPDRASDMATSLLLDLQQGAPGGFPNWGYFNNEAWVMNGYSGIPQIVNFWAFGAKEFDQKAMKESLIWAAENKYDRGSLYDSLGFVPANGSSWDYGVSRNLEYAIADFSVAQFCLAQGDEDANRKFRNRSQNFFNMLNPDGYLQHRRKDGSWIEPFQPETEMGFNEGNSAQYTWSVPHNMAGLIEKLGGQDATENRLDYFFSKILIEGWNTTQPHFWLANEPCFGVPWVYNWTGNPSKSQKLVKQILTNFNDTPDGLPGDDDVGAMSAWYIFSSIGFYPAIPGTGGFVVTGPVFRKVTIQTGNGTLLVLTAPESSEKNLFIQSLKLNGKPITSSWISLDKLLEKDNNTLDFKMGSEPDKNWGTGSESRPPSFGKIN